MKITESEFKSIVREVVVDVLKEARGYKSLSWDEIERSWGPAPDPDTDPAYELVDTYHNGRVREYRSNRDHLAIEVETQNKREAHKLAQKYFPDEYGR